MKKIYILQLFSKLKLKVQIIWVSLFYDEIKKKAVEKFYLFAETSSSLDDIKSYCLCKKYSHFVK